MNKDPFDCYDDFFKIVQNFLGGFLVEKIESEDFRDNQTYRPVLAGFHSGLFHSKHGSFFENVIDTSRYIRENLNDIFKELNPVYIDQSIGSQENT